MSATLRVLSAALLVGMLSAASHAEIEMTALAVPRQVTHEPRNHVLTNIGVWSPDSAWLVYDLRNDGAFDSTRIERVEVATGRVELLYEAKNGATCGVATHSPVANRVVFIGGPEHPDENWSYGITRRRGLVVDWGKENIVSPLDAMNYAPPFVAGALRGGSHVHVFSPDGEWVSFTYEDEVLAQLDRQPDAPAHEPNQRNVGVAVPAGPVRVTRSHPRNHDGDWFSVVVTRTVANPKAGSDQISRAFEEGWVGDHGYVRADGSRQRRALAFQGLVTAADGSTHAEVFIADLAEDLTVTDEAPLGGTALTRPAPPRGVVQRRLTFTDTQRFPGLAAAPRHWLRTSPDGARIAFLMKDDAGVVQLWTVSPNGGPQVQMTRNSTGIASAFSWSPDGRYLAHVVDGSVCLTDTTTGATHWLTAKTHHRVPLPWACVVSPNGRQIAFAAKVISAEGEFAQIFVVDVPEENGRETR